MRVLLTNNTLAARAGTELYVRDVALRLRELGHEPVAWSTRLGEVAAEIQRAGIPVTDDLAKLPFAPDIIHGHHHLETMTALLALPDVPAVYFCHGAVPWEEMPPLSPRILRYVAVDQACRERVINERGIPAAKTVTVLNFVDMQRFQPRPALPAQPRRALILSNYLCSEKTLSVLRRTCQRAGITLDVIGQPYQNVTDAPEKILPQYDLVFAKGRTALEALAVGCSVVVWHGDLCGPLVTARELDHLRRWNFGFRLADQPVTPEFVAGQLARYDAADAAAVSRKMRAEAGLNAAVDRIVQLYETVLAEQKQSPPNVAATHRANAVYWQSVLPRLKAGPPSVVQPSPRRGFAEMLARKADRLARWLRR